jgi:DmsE family decaheme c-type cytochrome
LVAVLVMTLALMLPGSVLSGDVTNDVCADCHEDVSEGFHMTAHGIYFSSRPALSEFGCESCHGSGIEHVEDPNPGNIINPAKSDQFGSSMLCLNCHQGDQFDDWNFAAHNGADLNCSSCHTAHMAVNAPTKKSSPDMCYDCHSDVRAQTMMPSHHPIAEGKMDCSDCHNPHGGSVALTQDGTGRELCFSCHADKEGPFVYEHAPVSEDCGFCHTPHGSVANNLLVANEPTLCLNCHGMHFHAGVEANEGDFAVPQAPERAGYSEEDGWKRGMLTKCTTCHSVIHGTDMPSQSISTGGNALTR